MKTLVVKIPEALDAELTRQARLRRVSKSALVRERLARSDGEQTQKPGMWDLIKDLTFDNTDAPTDLSSNPKHMEGYGEEAAPSRSRPVNLIEALGVGVGAIASGRRDLARNKKHLQGYGR